MRPAPVRAGPGHRKFMGVLVEKVRREPSAWSPDVFGPWQQQP
ncbi:hypothetical protein [Streptomyces sp. NRRL S-87]|nr:hypothetical protein [Streptomyces sp. NRRL S-87]